MRVVQAHLWFSKIIYNIIPVHIKGKLSANSTDLIIFEQKANYKGMEFCSLGFEDDNANAVVNLHQTNREMRCPGEL